MDEVNRSKWHNYYARAEESNEPPPWESSEPLAPLVEFITSHRRKLPSGKCVEFGCGSSSSSIFLAEQGYTVDAVDICPLAIERAAKFSNAHLVNWIEADLLTEDLFGAHLIEGDYDIVFDMQCFHVLRLIDEKKAASNIYRALKPGGTAIVVVGASLPDSISITKDANPQGHISTPGPPLLTLDELRGPLEAAGLTTVQLSLSRFNSSPNYARLPGGLAPLAWVGVFQKVLWSSEEQYALEVQAPFSTYILQGLKTIETRAYPLPVELLNKPIYLLESAQGQDGVSCIGDFIPARVATDIAGGAADAEGGATNDCCCASCSRVKETNAAADLLVQHAKKKGKASRVLAAKAATAMRLEALGEPSDDQCKAYSASALPNTCTASTTTTTASASAPATASVPRVIGTVVFTSCTQYTSQAAWDADRALHMVPLHSPYDYCEDTGVQRLTTHHAHLQTQASIGLKEGKVGELYAWNVGFVKGEVYNEFPALERVYRSLIKVVK